MFDLLDQIVFILSSHTKQVLFYVTNIFQYACLCGQHICCLLKMVFLANLNLQYSWWWWGNLEQFSNANSDFTIQKKNLIKASFKA